MEKEGENAGDSSSSSEESNGTQQELDESQTSMGQRSSEIIESITTHPSLPNQPLQQPIISPSIYNSSTKAMEWSHDERIQSHNHEQNNVVEQLLLSQVMEAPTQGSGNLMKNNTIRASNGYHLPTSNLPLQFRLDFSSIQSEQGNWSGSSLADTNWMNRHPFPHTHEPTIDLGPHGFGFQALLNQAIASDTCHMNDHDRPIQQMKTSLQEDPNLHFMDMSLKEGNQHQDIGLPSASGSRSKFIMNKLYDPSYEAMGLPVDPHLRMFQAKYGNAAENKDKGNEEHR
ncbi:hypothetical protein ERO13_A11G303832v2 [Gossypium hirsutum]|uniref:Uncharacterized protein n=1 Tax=Gossypium hirsutum TaxID=3635 RepID=A0ABM2Z039_GOSHI|nr:uncharacterized protein LOC121209466 [Gossypium hirsutum]KAG4177402.1 hypothetical protein ERO13_A11G303832v2 [Gossypium hirsutum]